MGSFSTNVAKKSQDLKEGALSLKQKAVQKKTLFLLSSAIALGRGGAVQNLYGKMLESLPLEHRDFTTTAQAVVGFFEARGERKKALFLAASALARVEDPLTVQAKPLASLFDGAANALFQRDPEGALGALGDIFNEAKKGSPLEMATAGRALVFSTGDYVLKPLARARATLRSLSLLLDPETELAERVDVALEALFLAKQAVDGARVRESLSAPHPASLPRTRSRARFPEGA